MSNIALTSSHDTVQANMLLEHVQNELLERYLRTALGCLGTNVQSRISFENIHHAQLAQAVPTPLEVASSNIIGFAACASDQKNDVLAKERRGSNGLCVVKPAVPQIEAFVRAIDAVARTQGEPTLPKQPEWISFADNKVSDDEAKNILHLIGENLHRNSSESYVDVSSLLPLQAEKDQSKETFPMILYRLLQAAEEEGNDDVISFLSHGRAFKIHNRKRFESEFLSKYFRHGKYPSFQRQLLLYGFKRIGSGQDAGGYYHELFLKGHFALCTYIKRVVSSKEDISRKRLRRMHPSRPKVPDFSSMPSLI